MKQSFNFYHKIYSIFFIPIFLTAMEENSIVLTAHTYNGNPFALLHQTFTDLKRYRSSEVETIDVDIKQLNKMEHLFANEAVLQCLQPEQVNQYKQAFPVLFRLLKKSISYIVPATHEIFIPSDAQESLFNQVVNDSSFNVSLRYKDYKNLVFHTFDLVDMHIKEQMHLCNELAEMYSQESIFICDTAKNCAIIGASHYDCIMATEGFFNDMYVEILTKLLILKKSFFYEHEFYCDSLNNQINRIKTDLLLAEKNLFNTHETHKTVEQFNKMYVELIILSHNIFRSFKDKFNYDDNSYTEFKNIFNQKMLETIEPLTEIKFSLDLPAMRFLCAHNGMAFSELQSKIQHIVMLNHQDNEKEINSLWSKFYLPFVNTNFVLQYYTVQQGQFSQNQQIAIVQQQQPIAAAQSTNTLNNVWSWLNSWQFKRK